MDGTKIRAPGRKLISGQPAIQDLEVVLPTNTPLTQPYWLREEGTPGMFRVDDASLIGRPENPPAFPVEQVFEVGGQTLVIPDEPVQIVTNAAGDEIRRKLDVIPPVSLEFASDVGLFAPGGSNAGGSGNCRGAFEFRRHAAIGSARRLENFTGKTSVQSWRRRRPADI